MKIKGAASSAAVADVRFERNLEISSYLSKLPIIGREEEQDVKRMMPAELIPLLQRAGVDFMLAGAHGASGWLAEPRATQDVDFLIRIKDKQRAANALLAKYPHWKVEKYPDVWRFKDGDEYVVDLLLTRAALLKRVISEFKLIQSCGQQVKVPRLEAALAMKFAAMTGHFRSLRRKYLDAADFMSMLEKTQTIDLALLQELGEWVYPGGGADILKYVDDVRNERRLEI